MKWSNLISKEDRLDSSTQDSGGGKETGIQGVLLSLWRVRVEDLIGRCLERIYEGVGKSSWSWNTQGEKKMT